MHGNPSRSRERSWTAVAPKRIQIQRADSHGCLQLGLAHELLPVLKIHTFDPGNLEATEWSLTRGDAHEN